MDKSSGMEIYTGPPWPPAQQSPRQNLRWQWTLMPRCHRLLCTHSPADWTVRKHSLCNSRHLRMRCIPRDTAKSKLIHYSHTLAQRHSCDTRNQSCTRQLGLLGTARALREWCCNETCNFNQLYRSRVLDGIQ